MTMVHTMVNITMPITGKLAMSLPSGPLWDTSAYAESPRLRNEVRKKGDE